MKFSKPYLNKLMGDADQLQEQINRMAVSLLTRENDLAQKQMALDRLKKLPFYLAPGNVGDVNRVIWPFWFGTVRADVAASPAASVSTSFSVTQEAAFVAMSYTKAVFLKTAGPFNVSYLDPTYTNGAGKATGLSFRFRDAQSTREFMQAPIDIDNFGNPLFPTKLPSPMLIMPRATIEVGFDNASANDYVVFLSFFGYRIRLEDAQNILSTVSESPDIGG